MKTTSAVWSGDNLHEVIGVIGLSAVARQMSWGEYEELVRREGLKVFTSDGPVVIEVGDIVFNSVGVVTVLHPERKQGMTLKEAYRVLRRFEDWRSGKDCRTVEEAFPTNEHREAIQLILAAQGLYKPIADCGRCRHYKGDDYIKNNRSYCIVCDHAVRGECTKFEEVKQ